MKIFWSDQSRKDLHAIKRYIAEGSEFYAEQMVQNIIFRVGMVADRTTIGHRVHEYPERPLLEIHEDPYRIIYKRTPGRVKVVTIVHFRKRLILK